jgi:hypothetical protein
VIVELGKTIDELLLEVKEDKVDNMSTTSFLFKRNLWDFFQGFQDKNCVEFGTHKGQTTRILAHLFKEVYTFNLPNHFYEAKHLNADLDNISYVGLDLYQSDIETTCKHKPVSMFFIDAVHTFDSVMSDVTRALNFNLADGDVYFVFDDVGLVPDVRFAVLQLIRIRKMEFVTGIGHKKGHSFGGVPERILRDDEGYICKLIR